MRRIFKATSWLLVLLLLASACVPMPQRVKDELAAPRDGEPNNFEMVSKGGQS